MLIGYAFTIAIYSSLILIIAAIVLERKGIKELLAEHVDRYSLTALILIVLFFLVFSITKVSPVEQLYFDENIYQGIAMNILHNGNALWCQYGTGYIKTCYVNSLYHDPIGWSAFIAIAFGIFGISFPTAWNLELFAGTLSIVFIFLLASLLINRKSYAVLATFAFVLMPQLFIWSRTQADVDLPFMMFATFTFLCFVIFTKRKTLGSLALFAFSLDLVSYFRIEAILLVVIFAVLFVTFGEKGVLSSLREKFKSVMHTLEQNTNALILLLIFVLLLLPELYYIAVQAQSPQYGQAANQSVVSIANFKANVGTNVNFIFGQLGGVNFYPTEFHLTITPLAIIGIALLLFDRRYKNRFSLLLLLLLWFFAYFLFYTFFYAGSATYGVDSRFMLQILPSLSLLAAFALVEAWDAVRLQNLSLACIIAVGLAAIFGAESIIFSNTELETIGAVAVAAFVLSYLICMALAKIGRRDNKALTAFSAVAVAALSFWLLGYPFLGLIPSITLAPQLMPQQSVILKAINFFYANYSAVPQNCVVFSNTPDIWEEVNRSSAQISYLESANATLTQNFSQYKCIVFDYGYWCVVPPFHDGLCKYLGSRYQYKNLTPTSQLGGSSVGFFQVLNYT